MALFADDSSPGIYGGYNEAARTATGVAPGSLVLIFSSGVPVGPLAPQQAAGYPLVTNLAGTSVRVTVGDQTLNAFILATESQWVRALLPSGTPLGDGRLTVTYNGRSSAPSGITVVKRAFGIYSGQYVPPAYLAPSFFVPRAVQNITSDGAPANNSFLAPARPGDFVILWGTGLGAAPGDEAPAPIPGDLRIPDLQVLVGNQHAKVVYAGRSAAVAAWMRSSCKCRL